MFKTDGCICRFCHEPAGWGSELPTFLYPLFWERSYVKHRLVKYKNEFKKDKGIACVNITFAHFHPRMAHWGELYGLSQKCQSALSGRSKSSDTCGRLGGSIPPVRGWEMLWQRPVAQRTSGNGVRNGANCQEGRSLRVHLEWRWLSQRASANVHLCDMWHRPRNIRPAVTMGKRSCFLSSFLVLRMSNRFAWYKMSSDGWPDD